MAGRVKWDLVVAEGSIDCVDDLEVVEVMDKLKQDLGKN